MRTLRAVSRLTTVIYLLVLLALDILLRPVKDKTDGAMRVHRCCRRIVRVLGIVWSMEGTIPSGGAVVSNHLSYLDILVYAAEQPFVMVAKSEVNLWPVIGWMTRQTGTVFVVRGGGPATYGGVNHAMAEAFRSGVPVLFFPEGTTTGGEEVLPFRRGLFHSVLNEGVALRPAAISYSLDGPNDEAMVGNDVCWWGDALLAPHLFRLAGLRNVRAKIRFGEAATERRDRFELSQRAHQEVTQMFDELNGRPAQPDVLAQEAETVETL